MSEEIGKQLGAKLQTNRDFRKLIIEGLAGQDIKDLLADVKGMNVLLKALSDDDKSLMGEVKLAQEKDSNDTNKELVQLAAEVIRQAPGRDLLAIENTPDTETPHVEVSEKELEVVGEIKDGELEEYSEPQSYEDFMKDHKDN